MGSQTRTTLLLAALTVLIMWVGKMIGGEQGLVVAFILALVMNIGSYWFSDKIVLAMYRAQPIEEHEDPQLYQIVRELAAEAHCQCPGYT